MVHTAVVVVVVVVVVGQGPMGKEPRTLFPFF